MRTANYTKLLSVFLALCLVLGSLPTVVFAADENCGCNPDGNCTCTSDECTCGDACTCTSGDCTSGGTGTPGTGDCTCGEASGQCTCKDECKCANCGCSSCAGKTVAVTDVKLDQTKLELKVDGTETLTATVEPSTATKKDVTWSSSDDTTVKVEANSGDSTKATITALKVGNATITVTTADGNKTAQCEVTVTAATVAVTGVTLSQNTLEVTEGDVATLTAEVTPGNATNQKVTWTSSDTTVATVSDKGEVKALKAGSTTITVTTEDGNHTATCTVKVNKLVVDLTNAQITVTNNNATYNGKEQKPTVSVTVNNNIVDPSKYTVNDATDGYINAGTYTVNITPVEGESINTPTTGATYTIQKLNLNDPSVAKSVSGPVTYTGKNQAPTVTVNFDGLSSSDYDVTCNSTAIDATTFIDAKTYTLTITAKADSTNFTGSATVNYVINPAIVNVTYSTVTGKLEAGTVLSVTVTCSDVDGFDEASVGYVWDVTGTPKDTKTYTVTSGDIEDQKEIKVTVSLKDTNNFAFAEGTETTHSFGVAGTTPLTVTWPSDTSYTYNKTAQAPEPTVTGGAAGTAYNVKYYSVGTNSDRSPIDGKPTNAGSYVVVVEPEEGYSISGAAEKAFTINKATATVTVSPSNVNLKLKDGETVTGQVTVTFDESVASVTVASNSTTIATVDKTSVATSGDIITITAKAAGSTTITFSVTVTDSTNYEATSGSITVTVTAADASGGQITGITLNKTSATLTSRGATVQLSVSWTPSDAAAPTVTWSSSNTSVATVDANGKVTAVANGTAVITATTDNGMTATCTVTVSIIPSRPSTPSTPAPDATVEDPKTDKDSGETTVEVSAESTTQGTTAKTEINSKNMNSAVDSAIEAAAKDQTAPVVSIEVKVSEKADSLNVTLPTASLGTLAKAEDSSLVVTSKIAEIRLDNTALNALVEQATGSTVVLEVTPTAEKDLTKAQQDALTGLVGGSDSKAQPQAYDLSLVSSGKAIHSYNAGKISVTLPFAMPEGGKTGDIRVYYLNDNGMIERCKGISYTDGKVQFTTSHLSMYLISDSALTSEVEFVDVPADEWYPDFVNWAADNGVTVGADATHFEPGTICTRAQFVTFLWRAAGKPVVTNVENPFTDVSESEHGDYLPAILWAVKEGITFGTSDTTFEPGKAVTRGQAVTFMNRYAKKAGIATKTGVETFDDVNEDEVADYYDAIGWAVANGITKGNSTTENTFGPTDGCERAEMVTFLYRLFMIAA